MILKTEMKMKETGFGSLITGLIANRSIHSVGENPVSFFFSLRVADFTASTMVLKPRSRVLRRRLEPLRCRYLHSQIIYSANLVAAANSAISVFRMIFLHAR